MSEEAARKVISREVLMSLLNVAQQNTDEVSSINGDFRQTLQTHAEGSGLNLKAWPAYRSVKRAWKRSAADALKLIEDIGIGLDHLEDEIRKQGDLLAQQANSATGKATGARKSMDDDEDEFDKAAPQAPDPDAEAAQANSKALENGIKPLSKKEQAKLDAKAKADKAEKRSAEKAAQKAAQKVIDDKARGLGPDAVH